MNVNKTFAKPFLLFGLLVLIAVYSQAQGNKTVRYYNVSLRQVPKDSAFYIAEFIKTDTLYEVKRYWAKSMRLKSVGTYSDTTLFNPKGLLIAYHENGAFKDSVIYDEESFPQYWRRYYPNGSLHVHFSADKTSGTTTTIAYDEDGNIIKDYIFIREAFFPGGNAAFSAYIGQKANKIKILKNTPRGQYKIIIRFVINKDGKVGDVEPVSNFGYKLEEQVIKIVENSPDWIPAVSEGVKVRAFRLLPVTINVG